MNRRGILTMASIAFALTGVVIEAQRGAKDGRWTNHSGDKGSTKYSALDQISKANVGKLRVVWRRPAVAEEFQRNRKDELVVASLFRSTPLMVDGVLFASNGNGLVEAFDPATGKTVWVQEPADSTPDVVEHASRSYRFTSWATRSRWYVASPNVNSEPLARLKYRCRSCSQVNPMPPCSWMPAAATRRYASET